MPTSKRASPNSRASTASAAASATAAAAPAINLQRIVKSVDPLGQAGAALETTLTPLRASAVTKIYAGFDLVHRSLTNIGTILQQTPLPAVLLGLVEQPGGGPAVNVQVELAPAGLGGTGDPVWALTDGAGHFQLTPPPGLLIPAGGLPLTVQGATARVTVTVAANLVASNGALGVIVLPQAVAPMPQSIIASLASIAGGLSGGGQPASPPPAAAVPTVTLGQEDGCQLTYNGQASIDRFPYGVFYRLVAPQLSIFQAFHWTRFGDRKIPLPAYLGQAEGLFGTSSYTDRVPVEQPLSVDGFRDQIMGLGAGGTFVSDETVPMAATLGLGYVLKLSQRWTFQGLALGDLVYSLPLAPGEQQQVAVFERTDTASVFESETLSESQAQQQIALADTSTNATFNSAFQEAASGGSSFHTDSDTISGGGNFLVWSASAGSSSSSGNSNSWMQGQRDAAEDAAQTTHSAAENQASARRNAARTGMRLATSSESEQITTRTITNHNHLHALTMQYWEVQRLYDVRTAVDDLEFVCLVPMQIVRFMPPGQPLTVGDPGALTASRQAVLNRYAAIIKHIDVLAVALPRGYQKGLATLRQFAGDPSAQVEPFGGAAEDVIKFTLTGTFIPGEDVWLNAVTTTGTRVGPCKLAPPSGFAIPDNKFQSQDDLLAYLRLLRIAPTVFSGALALPPSLDRTQIVGFEITRSFRQIDYTLASTPTHNLQQIAGIIGAVTGDWLGEFLAAQGTNLSVPPVTVHLAPSQLERELGGPLLYQFLAAIEEFDASGNQIASGKGETYANDNLFGVTLPPTPYPVPALQLAPMLRYNEILTIEMMAQHVVRNTTRYSKAVWASLTDEERAILLDEYTIGVPPNGIEDASQMIPLLDCVQNKVLGFFGNSMILPFTIPQSVTDAINQQQSAPGDANGQAPAPAFDPVQIKQSLLAYQQQSFVSPQSIIALPTRGVLGEAVLGHCPSGEKLDMTRFWNWQDSPSDTAPAISPITLPTTTPSIADTLTAPNTLGQLPSLINNVLSAPAPDTSLLKALGQAAASQKDFDTGLTGQAQLASLITNAQNVSNSARADALKAATDLQSQAMATVGNIVGGIYGGNPTAGSSAASAVKGGGAGDASAAKGKADDKSKAKAKPPAAKDKTDKTKDATDASKTDASDASDATDAGAGDLADDAGTLLA
ncbi:MAG TPA: hypothetical protein VH722_13765 [Alphaproteobacteria bacterium]|nr:hypothetical protein [Alphaproteobacteria bacterium]